MPGMKWTYKEEHPFEKRRAEGEKIRYKYSNIETSNLVLFKQSIAQLLALENVIMVHIELFSHIL